MFSLYVCDGITFRAHTTSDRRDSGTLQVIPAVLAQGHRAQLLRSLGAGLWISCFDFYGSSCIVSEPALFYTMSVRSPLQPLCTKNKETKKLYFEASKQL